MGEKWAGSTWLSPPWATVGSQNGEVGLAIGVHFSQTMTFPDQRHINTVRDALHQRYGSGAPVCL